MQNDRISGMDAQIRRLVPICIEIAVAHGAIGIQGVVDSQLGLEHAVPAADVGGLGDDASSFRPRAEMIRRGLGRRKQRKDREAEHKNSNPLTFLHWGIRSLAGPGDPAQVRTASFQCGISVLLPVFVTHMNVG